VNSQTEAYLTGVRTAKHGFKTRGSTAKRGQPTLIVLQKKTASETVQGRSLREASGA